MRSELTEWVYDTITFSYNQHGWLLPRFDNDQQCIDGFCWGIWQNEPHPQHLLVHKLQLWDIKFFTIAWITSLPSGQCQAVVMNGYCSLTSVRSRILQGYVPVLGPCVLLINLWDFYLPTIHPVIFLCSNGYTMNTSYMVVLLNWLSISRVTLLRK